VAVTTLGAAIAGLWSVSVGPLVLSDGPVAARAVFQAAVAAIWRLWSFSRLWVAVISRHSERAAEPPRR
jgi:hypothetical protein